MPILNKANRQVCDVDIKILKTGEPFMHFENANTTTVGLTGDSVYAMKKGSKAIAFQNPIEGTMTIEAQVVPFKFYALFSDGSIESDAVIPVKKTIKGSSGTISIQDTSGTIQEGSVYVYPAGEFGEEDKSIAGSFASGTFTASETSNISADKEYEVSYLISKTAGVKRISFNNKKIPQDYIITMDTIDKGEDGSFTPFIIKAYKASIQRNFELSFSSEGDPATVSVTFDLMEDADGNILDFIEDTSEE